MRAGLGGAAALLAPSFRRGARGQEFRPPFLLYVHCSGGWDPTMVFDPKLGSAFVTREPGATLGVGAADLSFVDHPSRPSVQSFFEKYGGNAAIVNGIATGSMTSRDATLATLGVTPPKFTRRTDWMSYYASYLNPLSDLPHVAIDAPFLPGPLTGVATRFTAADVAAAEEPRPAEEQLGADAEEALAAFRLEAYDPAFADKALATSLDGEKLRALSDAFAMEDVARTRLAEAVGSLGPQGGDSAFARHGKVAVELFASGASLAATVQCGSDMAWDTTRDHFARASVRWEELFSGLQAILAHAEQRGVLSDLVVVVASELGRAPRVDAAGGKGPWAYTSAMLWGWPFQGGAVAGATDDHVRGLAVDPLFGTIGGADAVVLDMGHVMATLYTATDVSLKLVLPEHDPLAQILAEVEA